MDVFLIFTLSESNHFSSTQDVLSLTQQSSDSPPLRIHNSLPIPNSLLSSEYLFIPYFPLTQVYHLPFINQAAYPKSFKTNHPQTENTLTLPHKQVHIQTKPPDKRFHHFQAMPPLTQISHLCPICSQRFYDTLSLKKHYNSSHGNEEDFPRNGEGGEEGTGWDSDDSVYGYC
jgi:hypothetical protein